MTTNSIAEAETDTADQVDLISHKRSWFKNLCLLFFALSSLFFVVATLVLYQSPYYRTKACLFELSHGGRGLTPYCLNQLSYDAYNFDSKELRTIIDDLVFEAKLRNIPLRESPLSWFSEDEEFVYDNIKDLYDNHVFLEQDSQILKFLAQPDLFKSHRFLLSEFRGDYEVLLTRLIELLEQAPERHLSFYLSAILEQIYRDNTDFDEADHRNRLESLLETRPEIHAKAPFLTVLLKYHLDYLRDYDQNDYLRIPYTLMLETVENSIARSKYPLVDNYFLYYLLSSNLTFEYLNLNHLEVDECEACLQQLVQDQQKDDYIIIDIFSDSAIEPAYFAKQLPLSVADMGQILSGLPLECNDYGELMFAYLFRCNDSGIRVDANSSLDIWRKCLNSARVELGLNSRMLSPNDVYWPSLIELDPENTLIQKAHLNAIGKCLPLLDQELSAIPMTQKSIAVYHVRDLVSRFNDLRQFFYSQDPFVVSRLGFEDFYADEFGDEFFQAITDFDCSSLESASKEELNELRQEFWQTVKTSSEKLPIHFRDCYLDRFFYLNPEAYKSLSANNLGYSLEPEVLDHGEKRNLRDPNKANFCADYLTVSEKFLRESSLEFAVLIDRYMTRRNRGRKFLRLDELEQTIAKHFSQLFKSPLNDQSKAHEMLSLLLAENFAAVLKLLADNPQLYLISSESCQLSGQDSVLTLIFRYLRERDFPTIYESFYHKPQFALLESYFPRYIQSRWQVFIEGQKIVNATNTKTLPSGQIAQQKTQGNKSDSASALSATKAESAVETEPTEAKTRGAQLEELIEFAEDFYCLGDDDEDDAERQQMKVKLMSYLSVNDEMLALTAAAVVAQIDLSGELALRELKSVIYDTKRSPMIRGGCICVFRRLRYSTKVREFLVELQQNLEPSLADVAKRSLAVIDCLNQRERQFVRGIVKVNDQ